MIAATTRFPRIPLSDALAEPDQAFVTTAWQEKTYRSAGSRDLSVQGHLKTPSRLKSDSGVYVSL